MVDPGGAEWAQMELIAIFWYTPSLSRDVNLYLLTHAMLIQLGYCDSENSSQPLFM